MGWPRHGKAGLKGAGPGQSQVCHIRFELFKDAFECGKGGDLVDADRMAARTAIFTVAKSGVGAADIAQ